MPNVTFAFTTAQINRITEATTLYNAGHGTTLTPKEFVFAVCVRPKVVELLRDKAALDAASTSQANVTTDLEGTP